MAICYPNVNFINDVPENLMSILKLECQKWDFKNQKPVYNRAFYKYVTRSFTVNKFSGIHNPPDTIQPIVDWICNQFENYIPYSATLIAMHPGQRYPAHADAFNYAHYAKRLHIPIISKQGNNHISFHKDSNSVWSIQYWRMEEAKLYELNNTEAHSAENLSDGWRVHLIVDIIDKQIFELRNDWHFTSQEQLKRSSEVEQGLLKSENLKHWSFKQMSLDNFNLQHQEKTNEK